MNADDEIDAIRQNPEKTKYLSTSIQFECSGALINVLDIVFKNNGTRNDAPTPITTLRISEAPDRSSRCSIRKLIQPPSNPASTMIPRRAKRFESIELRTPFKGQFCTGNFNSITLYGMIDSRYAPCDEAPQSERKKFCIVASVCIAPNVWRQHAEIGRASCRERV